jgi:TIR domain
LEPTGFDELGGNLAQSKVVVALFSGSYFDSDWCVHELDLIVERARRFKPDFLPESRLIIAVVGQDGEQIPDPVARIQRADISKFQGCVAQQERPRLL